MPASDLVMHHWPARLVKYILVGRIWSNPPPGRRQDPDLKVGAMELTLADSVHQKEMLGKCWCCYRLHLQSRTNQSQPFLGGPEMTRNWWNREPKTQPPFADTH